LAPQRLPQRLSLRLPQCLSQRLYSHYILQTFPAAA
jgi:hypothetical protein